MACAAPPDLHTETGHMIRYGQDARQRDRRAAGETVTPASARLPVLVPIMTEAQRRPYRVVEAAGAFVVPMERGRPDGGVADPIAVDVTQLTDFIREQYRLAVVDIRAANGRYAGSRNELHVRLVPSARTQEDALHEFMLVCAGVYGMDPGRTIDVVRMSAVDRSLGSWLDMRTTMTAFGAYQRGDLDLAAWVRDLHMERH